MIYVQKHHAHDKGLQGAAGFAGENLRGHCDVGLLVPAHIGIGCCGGQNVDSSTAGFPGRLAATWFEGALKRWLLLLSACLWHSEGLTRRNLIILQAVGKDIARFGGPWLLADFNITPKDLQS